jgi:hypothetical protein
LVFSEITTGENTGLTHVVSDSKSPAFMGDFGSRCMFYGFSPYSVNCSIRMGIGAEIPRNMKEIARIL